MISVHEAPFLLDGVRVWVQCIECFGRAQAQTLPGHHHHHEYIELLYALEADMDVWINGAPSRLGSDQAIVIHSGEPHTMTFHTDSRYICIKLSPRVLLWDDSAFPSFELFRPLLSDRSLKRVFGRHELEGLDLRALFCEAMEEWTQRKTAYELCIRANVQRIFTGILRAWEEQDVFWARDAIPDPIRRALRYVSDHPDRATAQGAAEASGLSYHYFSSLFKRSVGKTFVDYLTLLRLGEAERLLITTERTVTDVAYACGFCSTSHFISRFRAYKGLTPAQVRRRARGESSR